MESKDKMKELRGEIKAKQLIIEDKESEIDEMKMIQE